MRCVSAVGSCSAVSIVERVELGVDGTVRVAVLRWLFTGKWRMCEGVLLTQNATCGLYKFTVNRGLKPLLLASFRVRALM